MTIISFILASVAATLIAAVTWAFGCVTARGAATIYLGTSVVAGVLGPAIGHMVRRFGKWHQGGSAGK